MKQFIISEKISLSLQLTHRIKIFPKIVFEMRGELEALSSIASLCLLLQARLYKKRFGAPASVSAHSSAEPDARKGQVAQLQSLK